MFITVMNRKGAINYCYQNHNKTVIMISIFDSNMWCYRKTLDELRS